MKPLKKSPAHTSDLFAELVCSNSLKSQELTTAAGLLKEELKSARELGDLSENFEYRAAKRELGRNNSRIRYLQMMIDTAKIVEVKSADGVIGLFDKVKLFDEYMGEEMEIVVVTTLLQNMLEGYISKDSPLGKAIIGKKVGDRVLIVVNDKFSYYVKVLSVEKGQDDENLKISAF